MHRRQVLTLTATAALAATLPGFARAAFAPTPNNGWRNFELTTRVTLPTKGAAAQAWVPVPNMAEPLWSRPGDTTFSGNSAESALGEAADGKVKFVHATWPEGTDEAVLEVVSTVATRDRAVDLSSAGASIAPLDKAERARHLAPTELLPTDGIVADTAREAVGDATNDLEKARAIYNWVVESSYRDPKTRGCGLGDVATMLHSGNLSGKCADLNALFVALSRAAGIPARDLYGLRVAPSAFGYKSLGAGSEVVSKAQHCRAEIWLEGFGWVAADPADVRKVVLEEPPKTLTLSDDKVIDARNGLFGASEGNWIAYNDAHDVALPGSTQGTLPFLMYPQAEIAGVAQDELDPPSFAYEITAREIAG
ncbi:transglutaminase-like domain-containing protein [Vannielia sp.]|uniref:transglutaminase-like domain-containing protein n=1 Tax=Vannielia sp. TaxID=2813045 RepID=UPI002615FAC8|nr:transglutaminase domain-containing protein [Vannielia sp.]MDF1873443.1 transglutaminase domain-containing protein [Vannielia sp.]